MIRRLLNSWRPLVSCALVALTAGLSLGPVLHGGGHDADCEPVVVVHDAAQHALAAAPSEAGTPPSDEHCVTCHLFRLSRLSQDAGPVSACDQHGRALIGPADSSLQSRSESLPLPARAPPV